MAYIGGTLDAAISDSELRSSLFDSRIPAVEEELWGELSPAHGHAHLVLGMLSTAENQGFST
jgi:hypothetical protein